MSQLFNLPNFADDNLQDVTALTAAAAAGQPSIAVEGVKGMSANDIGYLGALGSVAGEIQRIQTITNLSIQFYANLINKHRQTEPFYSLFGNQIKAYRVAADPTGYPPPDSVFLANPLGSPFAIDQDSPVTQFIDGSGGEGFWYKFVFFNSFTSAATPIQNALLIRGGNSRNYCSNEDTRKEAGLTSNLQLADTQVDARRQQADSQIDATLLAAGYTLPMKDGQGNLYYPPLITNIARLLSAGYVLIQDYGPITEGNSKDGADKLKAANQLLEDLQQRKKILVDLAGNAMSMANRVRGWPDDTTAIYSAGIDPNAGEPPLFTMDRKF
jgi:hypothetical protein